MIGDIVRKKRKQKKYSLRKLAGLSGLSHSFISDIEHGRCNPSIKSLKKIAYALKEKPEIFLSEMVGDNDPYKEKHIKD